MSAPDAVEQATWFDPTTADRVAVEAERARERRIRAEQADRIAVELARFGLGEAAVIARGVNTDPLW